MAHRAHFAQRGFTLIEAMVVIAIMAILAGAGTASFVWLNQATQIRGAAFDLVADLDFARSEAVKRNGNVVVAPVGDDWGNGWTVLVGATALRQRPAVGAQVEFTEAPDSLTFDGAGRLNPGAVGSFRICPPDGGSVAGRTVRIDPSGLSRSTRSSCAA